jgi:ribose-phosphate pyrophosphokinase
MAELSITAGVDRLVNWHPHSRQTRGFYGDIRVDFLEGLAFFVHEFRRFQGREDVIIVAPDAGASKLATFLGRELGLKSAIASKFRPEPERAEISEVIGDFSDKRVAIVIDDLISSGGTVSAVIKKLVEEKGIEEVYLGVSHNLCTEQAEEILLELHTGYHLKGFVVTNSIPQSEKFRNLPFIAVKCLADTLVHVINRIHYNQSVSELFQASFQSEIS